MTTICFILRSRADAGAVESLRKGTNRQKRLEPKTAVRVTMMHNTSCKCHSTALRSPEL